MVMMTMITAIMSIMMKEIASDDYDDGNDYGMKSSYDVGMKMVMVMW